MAVFLVEWTFTFAALLVLALTGGFVLAAFRQGRRFVLLLAPMCGLLVLPVVTTLIYTFGRASLSRAAACAYATHAAETVSGLTFRSTLRPIASYGLVWLFA